MKVPPPPSFGLPALSWRPHQAETILRALDSTKRFVVIQAPTGTGKSLIAGGIARLFGRRAVILTATKGLQDQYEAMRLPESADIRGAANYECVAALEQFKSHFPGRRHVGCDEGPCFVGFDCALRRGGGCYFFDSLRDAAHQNVVTTSFAFWLSGDPDRLNVVREQQKAGRPLLILDEAHDAPAQVLEASQVELSSWDVGQMPNAATAQEWRAWAKSLIAEVKERAETSERSKERHRWKRALDRLETIASVDDHNWAWECQTSSKARFAPLRAAPYLSRLVRGAEKVVLLSATVTPQTLKELGVDEDEVEWIILPSPFPKGRRPIYVLKSAGRIDYRMTPEIEQSWIAQIDQFAAARPSSKGIIHSVSYARAARIFERSALSGRMILSRSGADLAQKLVQFREACASSGAILVSPALMTGYNFPHDEARWQIIAKTPFPDTTSAITKKRIEVDPQYRDSLTLQQIVQAAGRIVRAEDDWGETIILDAHAVWFLKRQIKNMPASFREAVKLVSSLPAPLSCP